MLMLRDQIAVARRERWSEERIAKAFGATPASVRWRLRYAEIEEDRAEARNRRPVAAR
jgi:hypothetical protein